MTPYLNLAFDVVVVIALGVTIFYAVRLSSQFSRIQSDRQAFEKLIQALNIASERSEYAIRSLKEAATENGDRLQEKVNAARALTEELEIMIHAGDNLAERLQKIAEQSRKTVVSSSGVELTDEIIREPASQPRTRAEKDLLEALRKKQQT